jgi:SAM-dependent methyltransferase
MTVKLGSYEVPEDWPVKGEVARTFHQKLRNGFFATYLAGETIIDVGYHGGYDDAVPIFPHAIGVDLDFPKYDGTKLPFADGSVDTVHSSHMLEHVADYRATIRDWYRVLKLGGFIVCTVPHQLLYEKKSSLPSLWNADHKRFYTPASLLREFETSLEPNSYRVRHLRDNDEGYTYEIGPQAHAGGAYEIEIVVQKIAKPDWDIAGPSDSLDAEPAAVEDQIARLAAERDGFARQSAKWFDAAILASAQWIFRTPHPRQGRGWRRLAQSVNAVFCRTSGEAIERADRARDASEWERAARFYLDALSLTPGASDLWLRLGHALDAAGKHAEAGFAFREAEHRAPQSRRSHRGRR